jgi:DNA-binding NarL/FixJ family response regulator
MLYEAYPQARILIVDDQEIDRALLGHLLTQAGYQHIQSIADPRETLAAVAEHQPDIILLDLLMPHLDGFGVMAQLRQVILPGEFLPIVMLTAETTSDARQAALTRGVDDFLTKPFDPAEVLLRVRNLLGTRMLHLQVRHQNDALEEEVSRRTYDLELRTRELEEARAEVLGLYQELARRNQHLQTLVEQMSARFSVPGSSAAMPSSATLSAATSSGATTSAGGPHSQAGQATLVDSLTAREHEVLRLLAQGQTNREIAQSLIISPATIKWHVEHIIAKLGVADRTQAAVRAVELGLLHA